jgi:hypothetical protein
MSNHNYEWPPSETDEAEEWASERPLDAIAYAAMWTHSGQGYGLEQSREEWPEMPGFDYDSGLPDWDTGIEEESGYEYRTVLLAGDPYTMPPKKTDDGWELVSAFGINPEPELYDEDGSPSGHMYIGEGNQEVVYRRPDDWDEDDYEPNAGSFHPISDDRADQLLRQHGGVGVQGYVTTIPRALTRTFGEPGHGDEYKSGIEWSFESDAGQLVMVSDDRATAYYRTGLPHRDKLKRSGDLLQLRVHADDEAAFLEFSRWLATRVPVTQSMSLGEWLALGDDG